VEDSVTDGSADGVSVATGVSVADGVGLVRSESVDSLQPKKLERINTVPTAPTMRFVLLSDFKLHCLNDTI
jgi:hypothetical protein